MSDNSEKKPPYDDSKPVSPGEFQQMKAHYKETNTSGDDTESTWFSADSIMALIRDNQANGVRIYYGRYDNDHPLYPGRHNVILVATHDANNPEKPVAETSYDLLGDGTEATDDSNDPYYKCGLDHGALCPPRCTP